MGLLDVILGRSKPVQPDLDRLFALPSASVALQAVTGLAPTGSGSVCFKTAEGGGFAGAAEEARQLVALDSERYTESTDNYGYTWITCTTEPDSLETLVAELHSVNTALVETGFGSALLCTVVVFHGDAGRVALVYLYKRGTWYPYAPAEPGHRDSALELQVRAAVEHDLPLEGDLNRWFSLEGAPGL